MLMRFIVSFVLIFFNVSVWSFTCFYTLVKDSCWTNYDVTVDVIDAGTRKNLFSVTVPAGKSWERIKFSCQEKQGLKYIAHYSPVFWQSEKGKSYHALRSWFLPGTINPGNLAWTIPVCFPADFSQVPLPPDAKGTCKCDMKSIPKPEV